MELAKSFEPATIESFWRTEWEQRGYFTATTDESNLPSVFSCHRQTSLALCTWAMRLTKLLWI